jgi:hypothetical protein
MHRVVAVVRWVESRLDSCPVVSSQLSSFVGLSTLGECLFPQGEVFPFLLQRRTP